MSEPEKARRAVVEPHANGTVVESASAALDLHVTFASDGAPGAGLRGRILSRSDWEFGGRFECDADGRARLEGIKPGLWGVYLTAYRGQEVDLKAGELTPLELVIEEGMQLTGVVVDPQGQPVASAGIYTTMRSDDPIEDCRITSTDQNGRFHIRDLLPGVAICAYARHFVVFEVNGCVVIACIAGFHLT